VITTKTMTEEDALVVLGQAAGEHACPVHELGPVAGHLAGPVAAIRPDWHPVPITGQNNAAHVDRLIRLAGAGRPIECTCSVGPSPNLAVLPNGSAGAVAYPLPSDFETQVAVDAALMSVDVDRALPLLDPRLDALLMLSDRARATAGGVLDEPVREAVEVLAASLCGRTRWDTVHGWDTREATRQWRRHSHLGIKVDRFLRDHGVGAHIVKRLVEGA